MSKPEVSDSDFERTAELGHLLLFLRGVPIKRPSYRKATIKKKKKSRPSLKAHISAVSSTGSDLRALGAEWLAECLAALSNTSCKMSTSLGSPQDFSSSLPTTWTVTSKPGQEWRLSEGCVLLW